MTKSILTAVLALLFSAPALSQEQHQRRIPHRPDQPSIKEMVTKKYEGLEGFLTNMIRQRQATIDAHLSGRKLLNDEELTRHHNHVKGLHRKLAGHKQKDPELIQLEIEHEIELQEKMLKGEFIWTPGADDLILKEP